MQEFPFSGQLTEADYRSINRFATRRVWTVAIVLVIAIVAFNAWNGSLEESLSGLIPAILTWLPVAIIIPAFFIALKYSVRRHWRSNKIMQRPVSGTVSDEGIKWEVGGVSSSLVPWELCLKYRDSSDVLLIYQGVNQVFYFFPRYFANEAQWQEFRELVSRKLPRK
jgi:hypothetical protein